MKINFLTITLITLLVSCNQDQESKADFKVLAEEEYMTKSELGELLFNDTKLSINGTMACATCHKERKVFMDDPS